MKRKLMITALAAALSLGANAGTITWGMDYFMLSKLQAELLQDYGGMDGFTGNVVFILLDCSDGNVYDYILRPAWPYMTINDLEPWTLGVWETDIFGMTDLGEWDEEHKVFTPNPNGGTLFPIGDIGANVTKVQLLTLFLDSGPYNITKWGAEDFYDTYPSFPLMDVTGDIITFMDYDWQAMDPYFYHVPEPGTGLLALVGAAALLLRRRKGIVAAASLPPDNG